jgi:thioredoxin 2
MVSTHFTMHCPSCGTVNRIPADKEGMHGRCGTCKADLPALYSKPLALDDAGFDTFVNNCGLPVLAEFWAPW